MKKLINVLGLTISVLLIIAQEGCGNKTIEPISGQSFYFDTVCSIAIYDMDEMSEESANDAIHEAFELCSRYESLLSRTKEGTDIYRINHAEGEPVECDPETIRVIEKGLLYSELSGGTFDITIGRVSDLWDFHAEKPAVPSKEALQEAVSTVDYRKVMIEGSTVTLKDPGTHLDLGGIAKGYIADRISENLRENGVKSAVISLGGNVVCVGAKESGGAKPFRVGIEKPYSEQSEIMGIVEVQDETVVTSGVYQRYFEEDGVRYHHILDATSGYPAQSDILGVTLKAVDGRSADCDALATIYLIMGSEKALEAAEAEEGIEAYFVLTDGSCLHTEGMHVMTE